MDIVKITDGDYERYEQLLLQKDSLLKDAAIYERAYIRAFGELTNLVFKEKIKCIEYKKKLNYCQMAINNGKEPDMKGIEEKLKAEMASYYDELDDMIADFERSKIKEVRTAAEMEELRKIYHRIAKLLHPDISPVLGDYPELKELWMRAVIAYRCNDLKGLREADVLVSKAFADLGIESCRVSIADIAKCIEEVQADIDMITSSIPYTYKLLLFDDAAVKKKKDELKAELNSFRDYSQLLDKELHRLGLNSL